MSGDACVRVRRGRVSRQGWWIELVVLLLLFYDTVIVKEMEKETANVIDGVKGRRRKGWADEKTQAVVGGKHLKSTPHCLLYTPGSQDWIIP